MALSTTARFPAGNFRHIAELWAGWGVMWHIPELGGFSASATCKKLSIEFNVCDAV
jgi:hypothetical protein